MTRQCRTAAAHRLRQPQHPLRPPRPQVRPSVRQRLGTLRRTGHKRHGRRHRQRPRLARRGVTACPSCGAGVPPAQCFPPLCLAHTYTLASGSAGGSSAAAAPAPATATAAGMICGDAGQVPGVRCGGRYQRISPMTSTTVLLAGLAINVCFALLCHAFFREYFLASAGAAVVTSLTWQSLNYWHLGHLDPFFPIALVTGGVVAFVLSLLVGLPFARARRRLRVEPAARDRGFHPVVPSPMREPRTMDDPPTGSSS